jgi:tetratricopeptide (TPR) repeat protein
VARGTQHRKRRPTRNAPPPALAAEQKRKQKPPQWQEELFFQRLRTHAKWAYVFLAAAFLATFVLLGVGSGSSDLSSIFQNAFGGSGGTSIGKLESKVNKHPQDAASWRELATAYETKQRSADAITALERYTALKPKDAGALSELGSQYTNLANTYATDYQNAQLEGAMAAPQTLFTPPASTTFGKIFADPKGLQDPIATLLQSQATTKLQAAYSKYQQAQSNAEATYKKVAKLTPNDVTVQYQLGQAAQAAGDYAGAAAAYRRFLKLAPTDVDAPQVKQLLQQALASAAASPASSSG